MTRNKPTYKKGRGFAVVKFPHYYSTIIYAIGVTDAEYKAYMDVIKKTLIKLHGADSFVVKNFESSVDAAAYSADHYNKTGLTVTNSELDTIIVRLFTPLNFSSVGTLAHEAIHAVHDIFNKKGIMADNDNDEQLCYMVGYNVDEVAQQLGL